MGVSPGVLPSLAGGARHASRGRRSVPLWGVASQRCSGRQCTPGDALSRQDTVTVWSFFGQRRCRDAERVAALSCLECMSPAPPRLDQHRTVSRPFPHHVCALSLVPAQQRWQHHPGFEAVTKPQPTGRAKRCANPRTSTRFRARMSAGQCSMSDDLFLGKHTSSWTTRRAGHVRKASWLSSHHARTIRHDHAYFPDIGPLGNTADKVEGCYALSLLQL